MPKANATETCPGCNFKFSPSGLSHHLSQMKKPTCVAIHQSHPELASGLAPWFADINFDTLPVPFQGDYYGDYSAHDFDNPMEPSPSLSPYASDSSSESDDKFSIEVERTVWEPHPAQAAGDSTRPQQNPPTLSSLDGPAIPKAAEHKAVERETRRKTFAIRFKASTAGAPIPAGEVEVVDGASTTSYKSYGEQVGDSTEGNPYHPFTTRLEWEVARWAKLRGSGSTAFSDLLAIEGVRTHLG